MTKFVEKQTIALLEDIERRLDPETEADLTGQWEQFWNGEAEEEIFSPCRIRTSEPCVKPEPVHINDAINSYDLMLRDQLSLVSHALSTPHKNPAMRANYGTGIISSLFGAEIFEMPRSMNTLPTTRSFGDTEIIRELVEKEMPDLMGGFGRRVLEFGEICAELFESYPNVKRWVEVYHPDVQGPLDLCELMWGEEMFYALYDEPELVHGMLQLISDTYTAFLNRWYEIFPRNSHLNAHWDSLRHRGSIVLRDDSAMNLSPELYREFAVPYDGLLLERFDGGVIHFCGRGDHYVPILSTLPKLYGINMSQPELNDMETIYRNTVDKGIRILAFSREWAKKDVNRQGRFHKQISVHIHFICRMACFINNTSR